MWWDVNVVPRPCRLEVLPKGVKETKDPSRLLKINWYASGSSLSQNTHTPERKQKKTILKLAHR